VKSETKEARWLRYLLIAFMGMSTPKRTPTSILKDAVVVEPVTVDIKKRGGPEQGSHMPEEGCDLQKNLGELFVLFRKSRGLTQREAGVLCNTSQAQITYLEKGQGNLKLDTLVKYANAYGYDIEVVFSVPSSDSSDLVDKETL